MLFIYQWPLPPSHQSPSAPFIVLFHLHLSSSLDILFQSFLVWSDAEVGRSQVALLTIRSLVWIPCKRASIDEREQPPIRETLGSMTRCDWRILATFDKQIFRQVQRVARVGLKCTHRHTHTRTYAYVNTQACALTHTHTHTQTEWGGLHVI